MAPASHAPGGFTERTPQERGFAAVFRREIAPQLEMIEAERRRRRGQMHACVAAIAGACLVGAGIIWAFDSDPGAILIPVILGCVLCGAVYVGFDRSFRDRVAQVVMPPVCRFVGDMTYERRPRGRIPLGRFEDLMVVDSHSRAEVEDVIAGRHRDTDFTMAEVRLSRRSGKRTKRVFEGLVLQIAVPRPFAGRTVIAADRGGFGNRLVGLFAVPGRCERLRFDDPDFESLFEVYTDDRAEAEALLVPQVRQSLVALSRDTGSRLRAAFADGQFLLSLRRRARHFEVASLRRSVLDIEESLHRVLEEATIPHRIIDYLHGDRPSSLRTAAS